jgi:murein DD-endopeptidase MepM/ murein hydrolase activator NlpD
MAKAQYAIDGKPGKGWKVTSYMGWRIHPIKKVKKHHNGTDIWSSHEPCWIEAPYDGKVIAVGNNPSGFGNYVQLLHNIRGEWYVTLYGHMANGSIKVKKGQKVTAGTPLGKMGSTGMSTGKHLHWELCKGKKWVWSDTGKNFIEPVKFFTALIAWEKSIATAPVEAKDTDPVAPAPTHDEDGATAAEVAESTPVTPVAPVSAPEPKARPTIKVGSKHVADVKYLQKKLGVATGGADGIFGPKTKAAVIAFQKKHGLTADGIVGPKTWKAIG